MALRYDLKSIYNKLDEDFTFNWDGEPYTVPAKTLKLYPSFLADHGAKRLAEHILSLKGEKRSQENVLAMQTELTQHEYEVVQLDIEVPTKSEVREEPAKKESPPEQPKEKEVKEEVKKTSKKKN